MKKSYHKVLIKFRFYYLFIYSKVTALARFQLIKTLYL